MKSPSGPQRSRPCTAWWRSLHRLSFSVVFCLLLFQGADAQSGRHRRRRTVEFPPFTVNLYATMGLTGRYSVQSRHASQGFQLVQEVANSEGWFKTSSGNQITMNLTVQDDRSSGDTAVELYRAAVASGSIDIFLGPYSSGISSAVAEEMNKTGNVLMLSQAATPSIYTQGMSNLFTVTILADSYYTWGLDRMHRAGARSVVFLQGDGQFAAALCEGAVRNARSFGYTILPEEEGAPLSISGGDITARIRQARSVDPDLVIGCGDLQAAVTMVSTSRALLFAPKAMIMAQAISNNFVEALGAPNANYIMGPLPWTEESDHCTITTTTTLKPLPVGSEGPEPPEGCLVFNSSKDFADRYEAKWGEAPAYQAAAAAAAAIAVMKAASMADAAGPPSKIRQALLEMDAMTIYGKLMFSPENGTRSENAISGIAQYWALGSEADSWSRYTELQVKFITTDVEANYPMPSWEGKEVSIYPCPGGRELSNYSLEGGGPNCSACPIGKYRGSTLECVDCAVGMYNTHAGSTGCIPCPVGANCTYAELTGDILATAGWYVLPDAQGTKNLYRCHPPDVCLGENKCVEHHVGVLCGSCKAGYTNQMRRQQGRCEKCQTTSDFGISLGIFSAISIIYGATLAYSARRAAHSLVALHCAIIRLTLNYAQLSGLTMIATDYLGGWASNYWFIWFTDIIIDPIQAFLSPDCLDLPGDGYMLFVLFAVVLMPFMVVLSYVVILVPSILYVLMFRYVPARPQKRAVYEYPGLDDEDQAKDPDAGDVPDTGAGVGTLSHCTGASSFAMRSFATRQDLRGTRDSRDSTQSRNSRFFSETLSDFTKHETCIDPDEGTGERNLNLVEFYEWLEQSGLALNPTVPWRELFKWIQCYAVQLNVIWIYILYPVCIRTLFIALRCESLDKLRLSYDLNVECMAGDHKPWAIVSIGAAILFGFGIPAVLFHRLRRYKKEMYRNDKSGAQTRWTYGFLFNGFEKSRYYFELVYFLRMFFVIVITDSPDRYLRMVGLLTVGAASTALHIAYEPFDNRGYFILDKLESWTLLCFMLPCACHLLFLLIRSVGDPSVVDMIDEFSIDVFAYLMVCLAHVGFISCALLALFKNVVTKDLFFIQENEVHLPGHLTRFQRLLLLCVPRPNHVKLIEETYELDTSHLSHNEKQFLCTALRDTLNCYLEAHFSEDLEDKANTYPATFYPSFLLAAVRVAFRRVNKYRRAKVEKLKHEREVRRRFGPLGYFLCSCCVRRCCGGRRGDWHDGNDPDAMDHTQSDVNTATVEQLQVALMLCWPGILDLNPEYFKAPTPDPSKQRANRTEYTWAQQDSIHELFQELRVRQGGHLHFKKDPEDKAVDRRSPFRLGEEEEHQDGTLESLGDWLGLQDTQDRAKAKEELHAKHDDLMDDVFELKNEKARLKLEIAAAKQRLAAKGIPLPQPSDPDDVSAASTTEAQPRQLFGVGDTRPYDSLPAAGRAALAARRARNRDQQAVVRGSDPQPRTEAAHQDDAASPMPAEATR